MEFWNSNLGNFDKGEAIHGSYKISDYYRIYCLVSSSSYIKKNVFLIKIEKNCRKSILKDYFVAVSKTSIFPINYLN